MMSLGGIFNLFIFGISRFTIWCQTIVLKKRGRIIFIGTRTKYFGKPILMLKRHSRLHIGEDCTLRSSLKSNALGIQHPIIFCTLREGAELKIGNNVGISGGTFCAATSISIGSSTLIGANTTVVDTDFHPLGIAERHVNNLENIPSKAVSIGENVFIGMGCLILKGVTIGNNSVIGAGSVVTRDIPCDVVAAGNPCTVIKKLAP